MRAGGGKDHNFLASSVNPIKNYIFGILTSRAIDWHIVESILRGLGGGVLRIFWGVLQFYWATFTKYNIFWDPQLKPSR